MNADSKMLHPCVHADILGVTNLKQAFHIATLIVGSWIKMVSLTPKSKDANTS